MLCQKLDVEEVVKSILDGVTKGTAGRPDANDLVVAEADERIHEQVEETGSPSEGHPHTCKHA